MLALSVLCISSLHAGVSVNTVVETSDGPKEIGVLQVGDKIICFNNNLLTEEKSVISIEEIETDKVVEITTEDGTTISVAADQQLFVPNKWLRADQLSLGDFLLKKDHSFLGITSIRHKNESAKLRFIVVEENHNFLASKNGVLVHNGAGGAAVGFWTGNIIAHGAWVGFYGAITAGTTCFAGPAVGAWAGGTAAYVCAPFHAATAMSLSLAGGILGGALTGPV